MRATTKKFGAALLFCAVASLAAVPAAADAVEDFYTGKTITVIVPFSPGGTTAALGQAVAATMGQYIPGKPDFVVEYMPGAGGLIGQNFAYNKAPRDGTAVFIPQDSTVVLQHLSPDVVEYDAKDFNWLGVVAQSKHVLAVRKDTGVETIDDLKTTKTFIGSSGAGSETDIYPRVTNALLDLNMEVVPGFPGGSSEVMVAVESGEMTGSVNGWQTWKRRPDVFEMVIPLVVYGHGREPELPDVPNLLELVQNEDDKSIVRFVSSIGPIGRGVATPPEVPEDRVAALRAAFQQMLGDAKFLEAMAAINVTLDPLTGEEAQRLVIEALDVSPEIIERTRQIVGEEKAG